MKHTITSRVVTAAAVLLVGACAQGGADGVGDAAPPAPRGDSAEVAAVMHTALPKVRYCHETALASTPGLEGTAVVRFTIDPTGRVTGAPQVTGMDDAAAFQTCLASRVAELVFPPRAAAIHVSYPFRFTVAAE